MARARSGSASGAAYDEIRSSLNRLQGNGADDMEKFRRDKEAGKASAAKTLRTKQADTVALMQKQIEHAFGELAQKEEDLRLAAEIGQHLLERVETTMTEVNDLKTDLATSNAELAKIKEEKSEWVRRERKLGVDIQDLEDQRRYTEAELRAAQEALREVREERGASSADGAELGDALRRLTALEKDHTELQRQYRTVGAQLEETKAAHRDDAGELEAARRELERLHGVESTAARLEREMADYREVKRAKQELEWDADHMNQALRETSAAYEQMQRDFAKLEAILEDARNELRRAGVTFDFSNSLDSQRPGAQRPGAAARATGSHMRSPSLADELNAGGDSSDDDSDGEDKPAAASSAGASAGSLPSVCEDTPLTGDEEEEKRKGRGLTKQRDFVDPLQRGGAGGDDEEEEETDEDLKMREFFQLTVLAIKINSGDILEHIQSISARKLYRKCKQQNIVFHQFHHWIKREITAAYIASRYEIADGDSSNERSAAPEGADRRRTTVSGRQRSATANSSATRIDEGRRVSQAMGGANYEPRTVERRTSRVTGQRAPDLSRQQPPLPPGPPPPQQ